MKILPSLLLTILLLTGAEAADQDLKKGKNTFTCAYMENPPYGVTAWSQSDLWKKKGARETRFVDYNSDAAKGLILDATTDRGVEKAEGVEEKVPRETAFSVVYNAEGIFLFIEGEEPGLKEVLDSLPNPASPARKESMEIFFVPGLYEVPYYQILTRPYTGETEFFDWGSPHRHFRSLGLHVRIESRPLKNGFGTFVFIPWEALHERLPLDGATWRFSIIRWMPFGKAGGVTWGGQVHDTGNFGLVEFQKPTPDQKLALQTRALRTAWFTFLATAGRAAGTWQDEQTGDPTFYADRLKPEIERLTQVGEALGSPDQWGKAAVDTAWAMVPVWMEFDYGVQALRTDYLLQKRLAGKTE